MPHCLSQTWMRALPSGVWGDHCLGLTGCLSLDLFIDLQGRHTGTRNEETWYKHVPALLMSCSLPNLQCVSSYFVVGNLLWGTCKLQKLLNQMSDIYLESMKLMMYWVRDKIGTTLPLWKNHLCHLHFGDYDPLTKQWDHWLVQPVHAPTGPCICFSSQTFLTRL